MPTNPKKKARILKTFKDSGTGERFTAGETPLIDAGAYANYEAAGLVEAVQSPKKATKKASPRAAAKASPAPTPPAPPASGDGADA